MKFKRTLLSILAISSIAIGTVASVASITTNNKSINVNQKNNKFDTFSNSSTRSVSSLGISPKSDISEFNNMFAADVKYQFDSVTTDLSNKQTEALALLNKWFDNIPSNALEKYTIKNLRVSATSTDGFVHIYFGLYDKVNTSVLIDQVDGFWTLTNKGITKTVNSFYKSTTKTAAEINTILSGDNKQQKDEIVKELIGAIGPNTNYTLNGLSFDEPNHRILIDNISVTNAIGNENIIPSLNLENKFIIVGNDYNTSNKKTVISSSSSYLSNPDFKDANDADKFKQLLDSNRSNEKIISQLINVANKPDGATTSIVSTEKVANSVKVVFSISKYFNNSGLIVDNSDNSYTVEITYSVFPIVGSKKTTISKYNILTVDSKEYAYQYNADDIKALIKKDIDDKSNTTNISNPVDGSNVTLVNIVEVNNKSGMIKANITLDKANNEEGVEKTDVVFNDIFFKVPKIIAEPTNIIRNETQITENINQFDEAIRNASGDMTQIKTLVQKYLSIVGYNDNVEYKINSIEKTKASTRNNNLTIEDAAIYKLNISLRNNIQFDDLYTYNMEFNGSFIVYLNVKMNTPTKVKDDVQANGIDATTSNSNTELMKWTADDLTNESKYGIIKQWIIDNFTDIFEGYSTSSVSLSDIAESPFTVTKINNTTISITLALNNAVTDQGIQKVEFNFQVKNLLKPINTTLVKNIEFNTSDASQYASVKAKDSEWLKTIITTEILKKDAANENQFVESAFNTNYFDNIPNDSLSVENSKFVSIDNISSDDASGSIKLTIKLPSFYEKGILYNAENGEYNNKVQNYDVTINGFQTIDHSFDSLSKTIDASGGQLNTSINDKQLVNSFDYKKAIKDNIITFLSSETIGHNFLPDEIQQMKTYMNGDFITDSSNSWDLKISKQTIKGLSDVNASVIVKSSKLAEISKNTIWSTGVEFKITNSKYAVSEISTTLIQDLTITLKEFNDSLSTKPLITLEKFGLTTNYMPLENYSDGSYTTYSSSVKLGVVSGDNDTGDAILKITFPKIYGSNYQEIENYEYTFNFKFKPSVPNTETDYIKNEINAESITIDASSSKKLSDLTQGEVLEAFNNPDNKAAINNWLNSDPNIYNEGVPKEPVSFDVATLSPNKDEITITVSLGNPAFKTEIIKITNLKTFAATDPKLIGSAIPEGLTISNVTSYDFLANKSKFISFTSGTMPNSSTAIDIVKVEISSSYDTVNQKVVFVDFVFNGVYLKDSDISSFEENYVVKIKLLFDKNNSESSYMIRVQEDENPPILSDSKSEKFYWFWIIIAVSSAILLLLLIILIIYVHNRRKRKNEIEE